MTMQIKTRRNLVVVRAGDQSLHPRWLAGAHERSWDLLVNYFGDDPARYRVDDVMRIDSKGPKWRSLKALVEGNRDLFERYDYIWFPDDDIDCRSADVDALFALARRHSLKLCQPSLTLDSHVAVWITSRNPLTTMRYTNYVENMVPCFSRESLFRCLCVMDKTISGWGIDHIWPRMIGDIQNRIAILNRVSVKHTRPIAVPGSANSNYVFMQGSNKTPLQEALELLKECDASNPEFTIKALVVGGMVKIRAGTALGKAILRLSYRVMILLGYVTRSPLRWELGSIMGGRMRDPTTSVGP